MHADTVLKIKLNEAAQSTDHEARDQSLKTT